MIFIRRAARKAKWRPVRGVGRLAGQHPAQAGAAGEGGLTTRAFRRAIRSRGGYRLFRAARLGAEAAANRSVADTPPEGAADQGWIAARRKALIDSGR